MDFDIRNTSVICQIINGDTGERSDPFKVLFGEVAERFVEFTPAERFTKDYVLFLAEVKGEDFHFSQYPLMVISTFCERYEELFV